MDARSAFPLTMAHLGALPEATTPEEMVVRVCEQHARGDIPSRAARDLVRFEALAQDLPPPAPGDRSSPRDDEPCVIAPHVRVLDFGASLPEMIGALREGLIAKPRPARGWLVLWRGGELILYRETGWLFQTFRKPTPPGDAIEDDEDRALFAQWWELGLLGRA